MCLLFELIDHFYYYILEFNFLIFPPPHYCLDSIGEVDFQGRAVILLLHVSVEIYTTRVIFGWRFQSSVLLLVGFYERLYRTVQWLSSSVFLISRSGIVAR
jgi:hypothetical protein